MMSSGSSADETAWNAARRWRQSEVEARVNGVRIIGVAAFYLVHLAHHFGARAGEGLLNFLGMPEGDVLSDRQHTAVTCLALAWVMLSLVVHACVRDRRAAAWLAPAATCGDVVLLTAVLLLSSGAASPLIAGYFLIVMMAGWRLDPRLASGATAGCIAGYVFVLGASRWPRGLLEDYALPVVPRYQQVIVIVALVLAGTIARQAARHARRLADDVARAARQRSDS